MSFHRYQSQHLQQPTTAMRSCAVSGLEKPANRRGFLDCGTILAEGTY